MRSYKIKILVSIITIFLLASAAAAQISPEQLDRVWNNVADTADLAHAPDVEIEKEKAPNAWVSFKADQYSVHITSGMMKLLDNEGELAGILAHETGHIKLGHYRQNMGRSILWSLLYGALGDSGNRLDPVAIGLSLAESGFSRQQEVAADDYGIELATKAGYSSWGLVKALEKMKEAGFETSPSGFNSHPPTDRRLYHVRQTASRFASN